MRALCCAAALLCVGCSLDPFEPTVSASDAGSRRDASIGDAGDARDAGDRDAGDRDAGDAMDAAIDDAGVEPTDAGFDADLPDTCVPRAETCNDADDDCDGRIDEDVTQACMNACGTPGTERCAAGVFEMCDAPMEPTESCNGIDDDCDGTVDEDARCPCTLAHHGGHAYLFCSQERWLRARDECRSLGYELATIDDMAENTFVGTTAFMEDESDWWIGYHDRSVEGVFEWVSGSASTFTAWGPTQPNNFGGNQNCAQIVDGSQTFETRGLWDDNSCNVSTPYVCESP